MSKGSGRRPTDEDKFKENFDRIFRKPAKDSGWPASVVYGDEYKAEQEAKNKDLRDLLDRMHTKLNS